nr:ethylene-responsive transcription factor 2-like [Ipomoea batatas]
MMYEDTEFMFDSAFLDSIQRYYFQDDFDTPAETQQVFCRRSSFPCLGENWGESTVPGDNSAHVDVCNNSSGWMPAVAATATATSVVKDEPEMGFNGIPGIWDFTVASPPEVERLSRRRLLKQINSGEPDPVRITAKKRLPSPENCSPSSSVTCEDGCPKRRKKVSKAMEPGNQPVRTDLLVSSSPANWRVPVRRWSGFQNQSAELVPVRGRTGFEFAGELETSSNWFQFAGELVLTDAGGFDAEIRREGRRWWRRVA